MIGMIQCHRLSHVGRVTVARILVIDDEVQMRRMLREALVRHGHAVDEAMDGLQALVRFAEQQPDLVITDIIMPEREGIETIQTFRGKCPTIPIIAVSGGGRRGPGGYLSTALELGANRAFRKPFRIEEVLTAVDELIASISQTP
jgi:CheY-like chemotaxis protein